MFELLRCYAQQHELYDDVSYWAPLQSKGVEVDFLLQRGRERLALEVKASGRFLTILVEGAEGPS